MKLSVSLLLLAPLLASSSSHVELERTIAQNSVPSYAAYIKAFGKTHKDEEEYQMRKAIFEENARAILQHNLHAKSSFQMGFNQFTDRLDSELPLGYDKSHHAAWSTQSATASQRLLKSKMELDLPSVELDELPAEIDWRFKGQVVTPVKNQGACGSCWAFAATAVLESHVALQTGKLFSLSMQELVSCAPNPNNCGGHGGCAGSTAEIAFDYVAKHGMAEEFSFGYQSYHGETIQCSIFHERNNSKPLRGVARSDEMVDRAVASILGYTQLPTNQYKALMIAVATMGPVAVSVAASGWGLYSGGIYDDDTMETRVINHAVVLVGYGTDQETGQDYWLIRNSWGPMWGEDGYIRLKRVDPSTLDDPSLDCKVDDQPSDGVACTKDDSGKDIIPKNATVCGTSGVLFDSSIPVGAHLI